jgi:SAM-dependent methyltransferase
MTAMWRHPFKNGRFWEGVKDGRSLTNPPDHGVLTLILTRIAMMESRNLSKFTAANKLTWEASAHLHGEGKDWEALVADAAKPNFSTLDDCISQTLKKLNISGRSAVQIGCNNGRELLSLASFGALPMLGIDQSPAFLAQGAHLSQLCGQSPRFLEADIYDLPSDVGRYDIVFITIGVLGWMPDLSRFFEVVAGLMNSDAKLVIYETHPFLEMFEPESAKPFEPHYSYFDNSAQPHEGAITYDGSEGGEAPTGYWFSHTLGAIVTACIAAGLTIEMLSEHAHSNREAEFDIYQGQKSQMPLSFTLIAAPFQ